MDHRSAREAILDGQVDGPAVQEHLVGCSSCRRFRSALLVVDRLSPTIAETASPPAGLVSRALKHVSRYYSNSSVDDVAGTSRQVLPDKVRGPLRFGLLLRYYRRTANLTQEELAERSGISVDAISALERGRRLRPHPSTVRFLAAGLGLSEAEQALLFAASRANDFATPIRQFRGAG